jgi:hypothetical protein
LVSHSIVSVGEIAGYREEASMKAVDRRKFLAMSSSVAVPFFTDLSFLAPLNQLAAEAAVGPITVERNADLDQLVRLIRQTPRGQCVPVFVNQLRDGLSGSTARIESGS